MQRDFLPCVFVYTTNDVTNRQSCASNTQLANEKLRLARLGNLYLDQCAGKSQYLNLAVLVIFLISFYVVK